MSGFAFKEKTQGRDDNFVLQRQNRYTGQGNQTGTLTQHKIHMEKSVESLFGNTRIHYNSAFCTRLDELNDRKGDWSEIGAGKTTEIIQRMSDNVVQCAKGKKSNNKKGKPHKNKHGKKHINSLEKRKDIEKRKEQIEILKKAVIAHADELNAAKDPTDSSKRKYSNKTLGPAVAGAYDRATHKIYYGYNDREGKPPANLTFHIKDKLDSMPKAIKEKYQKTRGIGSHAEVYAANKALLNNRKADISRILIWVNNRMGREKQTVEFPFPTCDHCEYILDGFDIVSDEYTKRKRR